MAFFFMGETRSCDGARPESVRLMDKMQSIGLMSGTSVDGLDVCCATFSREVGKWTYRIDAARGYGYPAELRQKLRDGVQHMSARDFVAFHSEYGRFLGERVQEFMQEFGIRPDIIASHGSTVFHEPGRGVCFQIGDALLFGDYDACLNIGGMLFKV